MVYSISSFLTTIPINLKFECYFPPIQDNSLIPRKLGQKLSIFHSSAWEQEISFNTSTEKDPEDEEDLHEETKHLK